MGVLPSGLVTFLFTDIESSTLLYQRLGEDAYSALLAEHNRVIGKAVEEHGGTVVKWLGDGAMAAFADAGPGLQAACKARADIAGHPRLAAAGIRIRAGLHSGHARPTADGDYTAFAVHVAARVSAAANGGQVLVSDDCAELVEILRPPLAWLELGRYTLRGLDTALGLRAVVSDPDAEEPRPRAVPELRHNVPVISTSFLGRAGELEALKALVTSTRLVSILGPGGAGKTRLGFEVVRDVSGTFADGAWVILLADLDRGARIEERVAATLGIRPGHGQSPMEALAEWARGHRALLLLDNCEHVLDSVAETVEQLFGSSSTVHVVLTSREPLRLIAEATWRIPLLTKDAGHEQDAIMLLRERAFLSRPDLSISDATAIRLCQELDGLPLAIELAAAQLTHTSPEALLERIHDRLSLLRSRDRDRPDRQRTLDALLAWSYDLLAQDEQRAFRRCAIFRSPFSVEAVAVLTGWQSARAEDVLVSLADRSLLQNSEESSGAFRMLMTIRDFALARQRDEGEAVEAADLHAMWVTAALEGSARSLELLRDNPDPARQLFDGLYDDALAALDHLEASGDLATLSRLANCLFDYWISRGFVVTGHRWLSVAARSHDARVISRAASLAMQLSSAPTAVLADLERACRLARENGPPEVLAECLARYGAKVAWHTNGERGEEELLEALAIAEMRDIDRGAALNGLAIVASARDDRLAAVARYEEASEACRYLPVSRALVDLNIAEERLEAGALDEAEKMITSAIPVLEARDPTMVIFGYELLSRVAAGRGEPALQLYALDHALTLLAQHGMQDSAEAAEIRAMRAAAEGTQLTVPRSLQSPGSRSADGQIT